LNGYMLKYHQDEIDKIKSSCGIEPINMVGAHKTLSKVKSMVEAVYDEVSYLSYDIEYHGWSGETAANIHKVEKDVVAALDHLYALCLAALGERRENNG